MIDDLQIRPAQPDDAPVAAVLLSSAYTTRQVSFPLPEGYEGGFLDRLEHFFRQDGNRFSYQYIQVAQHASMVVGLVLSFGGRDEERLNTAVGWRLAHESHDDEWYVDGLAVLSDWGRKGIGARLMQAAEQQARLHGYAKIALNVAQDNQQALSLYQRLHYVVTGETVLYQRRYLRMVKSVEN